MGARAYCLVLAAALLPLSGAHAGEASSNVPVQHERHASILPEPSNLVLFAAGSVLTVAAQCAKMVDQYALPFTVLVDHNGKTGAAYAAKTRTHMFLKPNVIVVYDRVATPAGSVGRVLTEIW